MNLPEWVEVRSVQPTNDPALSRLDQGERCAILLAQSEAEVLLLIDEAAGRLEASRRGIPNTGTVGILRAASIACATFRLDRPMPADLLVDRDQFGAQFLVAMVLIDFRLCLTPGGGRRKRFGDGFSFDLTCESNLGIVSRVVGLGAMAGWLSATARDSADRTWAQIAKGGELTKDFGSLGFQLRQRIRHKGWPPNTECI